MKDIKEITGKLMKLCSIIRVAYLSEKIAILIFLNRKISSESKL